MKSYFKLLLPCILIGIFGCKNTVSSDGAKRTLNDTFYLCEKLVMIDSISKETFEEIPAKSFDTSELRCILADSATVRRHGDSLIFAVANNKVITLVDVHAENDSASSYRYLGFNKEIGQYVVYGSFYEWYNYALIDKTTGDTTWTCGEPVVSVDKKYFICGNADLEAGFTFNGIELYENVHKPKLICRRELQNWGTTSIKWKSSNILFVQGLKFGSEKDMFYKLTIKQL